jgi:methyl-accepting chemotaxis protein
MIVAKPQQQAINRKGLSDTVFRTLRATMVIIFGTMLILALAVPTVVMYRTTRSAYEKLVTGDLEYMTEQLALAANGPASDTASPSDFARKGGLVLEGMAKNYFQKNGMTGYALLVDRSGKIIYHPKLEAGANFATDLGEQGTALFEQAKAADFNGTVYYPWQNKGEETPRDKVAVMRPLVSKPEWTLWVTAYTTDDLMKPFQRVTLITLAICGGVLILLLIGIYLQAQRITKPIVQLKAVVARVAAGDLRVTEGDLKRLLHRRDEVGDMGREMQRMRVELADLASTIQQETGAVQVASEELQGLSHHAARAADAAAQAAGQVAEGAAMQAAAAGEVGQTMAQFHSTIEQIASGAEDSASEVTRASDLLNNMVQNLCEVTSEAAETAGEALQAADTVNQSAEVVQQTVQGMERIRRTTAQTTQQVLGLQALSAQIGQITETISGIADQTNLLALNAAIEAARAGEQGRGFAVVADEVRRLAERSAASTRDISRLVGQIQSQTAEAARAIEAANAEVERGSSLATGAGEALEGIVRTVRSAAEQMQAIAGSAERVRAGASEVVAAFNSVAAVTEENTAATEEMAAGTTQVTNAVERIAGVSQESAAATEEVSSSVEELSTTAHRTAGAAADLSVIAGNLIRQVERFQVQ